MYPKGRPEDVVGGGATTNGQHLRVDRYADDLLGPEQPAPGSSSAADINRPGGDAEETKLLAGDVVGSRSHFDRFRHLR